MEFQVARLRSSKKEEEKENCIKLYHSKRLHVKSSLAEWFQSNHIEFVLIIADADPVKELEKLEWILYDFADQISWKTEYEDVYYYANEYLSESIKKISRRVEPELRKQHSQILSDIFNEIENLNASLESFTGLPRSDINYEVINNAKERIIGLLSRTIPLKNGEDFQSNASKNIDRGMFVDSLNEILKACTNYIEHLFYLVGDEISRVEWIFHIHWGMQKLDEMTDVIVKIKDVLEGFKEDHESYSQIQLVISQVLQTFDKTEALSMIWEKEDVLELEEQLKCQDVLYACDGMIENIKEVLDMEEGGDSN